MTTEPATTSTGTPTPRWFVKGVTRLHVFLNRLTGGRLFNTLGGDDVCFVTMKGAKSGRTLTIPLMYVPYRDSLLLVASQGGAPRKPRLVPQPRETPRDCGEPPPPPDGAPRSPRQLGGKVRALADLRPALRPLR